MIDIMLFLTMPIDLDVSCLSDEFPAKVSQGAFISLDKKEGHTYSIPGDQHKQYLFSTD